MSYCCLSADSGVGVNGSETVLEEVVGGDSSGGMDGDSVSSKIVKEDMGPWMLMSYKNKKKQADQPSLKKSNVQGSRFSVLQDDHTENDVEHGEDMEVNTTTQAPKIVKLWNSFQAKQKKVAETNTSSMTKSDPNIPKVASRNVSKAGVPSSSGSKFDVRPPLQDLSNGKLKVSSMSSNHY